MLDEPTMNFFTTKNSPKRKTLEHLEAQNLYKSVCLKHLEEREFVGVCFVVEIVHILQNES